MFNSVICRLQQKRSNKQLRKRTTTKQIQQAITNNFLKLTKSEIYRKSTRQTNIIAPDTFKESLEFLGETLFADAIGWHYEFDVKTGQCIVEAGRMNGDVDFMFIAHLCVSDDVKVESVDKALRVIEEE